MARVDVIQGDVTGPVADHIGIRTTLVAAAFIMVVPCILIVLVPGVRQVKRTPVEQHHGNRLAGRLDRVNQLLLATREIELGARLGLGAPGGKWAVDVWGANLTNKYIYQVAFDAPFQPSQINAFLADPRTFGITARTKF